MALFGFGKTEPTPTPAPQSGAEPTPTSTSTPAVDEGKEGLDKWADLFNTGEGEGEGDGEIVPFDPVATLQDEEAAAALMSKVNFRTFISEATQQKLNNDDPTALMDALDEMSKGAYLTALRHNQALTQRVLHDQTRSIDKNVSTRVTQSISDAELKRALPEISNPVVAAGIKPFVDQLRKQNPQMGPQEVVAEVKGYLQELNMQLNPDTKSKSPDPAKGEIDWLDDLGL